MAKKTKYNTTDLTPENEFNRHIYHRDQFAHYFRWSHVIKNLKRNMKVLDFGCGKGSLAEVIYRNRLKAEEYLGIDIRKKTIENNNKKYEKQDWINFVKDDLCSEELKPTHNNYDIVCSFEVIEHIGKHNGDIFLRNMAKYCNEKTIMLISTPCYDEKVGAAKNHMIPNPETGELEVGEFTYNELKELIEKYFIIEKNYGTFASMRDYKSKMNDSEKEMFDKLREYYDVNILSCLFAPLFPEYSRNCIWRCKLRKNICNKDIENN